MATEKYRRERPDRPEMPLYARVMLIFSVAQIVLASFLHMGNTANISLALLLIVAIPSLVLAVMAYFKWDSSRVLRGVTRTVLVGVPLLILGFGIYSALYATAYNPDSSAVNNWELYGSIALQFAQVVLIFELPALVAAASFGAIADRIILTASALLHTAAATFVTYYMAGSLNMVTFASDSPFVKLMYVAVMLVFTLMTVAPALGNDPDHTIRKA